MSLSETTINQEVERINRQLDELRRSFDDDIRHLPAEEMADTDEFLLMTLSGETYAYPVTHALEIVPVPTIIPVPGVPPSVLGIINFRGQILSVTTIAGLLGLPSREPDSNSRIVVTKGLPLFTGILVDSIEQIIDVASETIQPLPVTLSENKQRLLSGQFFVNRRVVFVLDLQQLCESESLYVSRAGSSNH